MINNSSLREGSEVSSPLGGGLRWGLFWVILLAVWVRIPLLFTNHFFADEALFATWARNIAVWRDPLLIQQAVDKPPLLFYLQALFYPLQGAVEWAARLPNFVASLLLIPLVGVLAWRWYGERETAVFSSIFLALSPLTIQFSATAFIDPLLTVWLVAAWVSVPVYAGLFFGLAIATKYQALLFFPLIIAIGLRQNWAWSDWRQWLWGCLPILFLLFVWEFVRTGSFTLWSTQISNFGGLRLVWSWEIWPRLLAWGGVWQGVFGLETAVLLIIFLIFCGYLWWNGRLPDRLIILFIFVYFAIHWLFAILVRDRYLLPIVPLVALLFGRGMWCVVRRITQSSNYPITQFLIFNLLLIAILLPAAISTRNGRSTLIADPIADTNTQQIAAYLIDAPYGTVLYDHWYSWHWRYHFFDKGVFVNWFPSATALTEDLVAFGDEGTRYLVAPQTAVFPPLQRAVDAAAYVLTPVVIDQQNQISLYQITPK